MSVRERNVFLALTMRGGVAAGGLGGFSGGLDLKGYLLEREGGLWLQNAPIRAEILSTSSLYSRPI